MGFELLKQALSELKVLRKQVLQPLNEMETRLQAENRIRSLVGDDTLSNYIIRDIKELGICTSTTYLAWLEDAESRLLRGESPYYVCNHYSLMWYKFKDIKTLESAIKEARTVQTQHALRHHDPDMKKE